MTDATEQSARQHKPQALGYAEYARYLWAQLRIRPTGIWEQGRELSTWLETDVFPLLAQAGESEMVLEIENDGSIHPVLPANLQAQRDADFRALGRFFLSVGIHRLVLEQRLEWNQITDILALLFAHRRRLRQDPVPSAGVVGRLTGPTGMLFSCTRVRLADGTLHVAYTYCISRLSAMLRWFKTRQVHFQDHRAIFRAAPKYAMLIALVALLHIGAFWLTDSWVVLTVLTVAESIFVFVLVYLILMAVGSLEYDKEEQRYRLGLAYNQLQRYARRVQDDLSRARSVQEQLLPDLSSMPLSDRLDWAGAFLPESEVGGDYFDVHAIDENRVAILFCDVSGHGMSAAFVTAILNTAFLGWVEEAREITDFVHRLNRRVCASTPTDSFAAVFAAVYDLENEQIEYVNSGHNPEPWIVPADPAKPIRRLDDSRGLLMGVDEELFTVGLQRKTLGRGDAIVLATDGIIEATDRAGQMFGKDRLEQLLARTRGQGPQHVVEQIVAETEKFTDGREPADDRTILAMCVRDR